MVFYACQPSKICDYMYSPAQDLKNVTNLPRSKPPGAIIDALEGQVPSHSAQVLGFMFRDVQGGEMIFVGFFSLVENYTSTARQESCFGTHNTGRQP
jgi:hypothetical protein